LYSQNYAAVGFYAQLENDGIDVWSKLIAMVQAGDNVTAFTTAGADNDKFSNVWASGLARDPSRGLPWDITGYGAPATPGLRTAMAVSDGSAQAATAPPWTNQLYAIDTSSSEVLVVTMSGHARISDASGNDYLVQDGDTFCHRTQGCDCPIQATDTPPILNLAGSGILLGVTGGLHGSTGAVAGMSLKDYCNRLTGTWTGTWQDHTPDTLSGTFTVTWVQKGNAVSGTITVGGTGCITTGTVTGVLSGNTITFGAVQGFRTINYNGTVGKGTMSGTYSAPKCGEAQGVWTATKKK
jgi:hypothetical protein